MKKEYGLYICTNDILTQSESWALYNSIRDEFKYEVVDGMARIKLTDEEIVIFKLKHGHNFILYNFYPK